MAEALDGLCVLVTRPRGQANELARLIEAHGARVLRFPALEIESDVNRDDVEAAIGDIRRFDIAIFISTNAVEHGVSFLGTEPGERPAIAAIGPSTARALADAGFDASIRAERGFTSEALLGEPAFADIAGKRIVIFRGVGGRAMLGQELERRGAEVVYAEVYRRDRPHQLSADIATELSAGNVDVVTATSAETLVNLHELAPQHAVAPLLRTQLVTASERVVKKAAALGFRQPALLASGPGDDALVQALIEWRQTADNNEASTDMAMTEQTESRAAQAEAAVAVPVEAATGPPATPDSTVTVRRAGGGALSLFAMLIAMAALAVAAWLWWQREQGADTAGLRLAEAQVEMEATRAEMETARAGIAALETKLDAALDRIAELTTVRGRVEARIEDLDDNLDAVGARMQAVEKSVDDVRGISAAARDNWVRAEAEYYLQAANSRLQLARDPDSALAALAAADDRLASLSDPAVFRVRQLLADEIEALRGVPRPDIEGIAHTLSGLAGRVDELPLVNSTPEPYGAGAGAPQLEGDSAMARFRATMLGVLGDIVSVKRTDEEATPLLSRDEEFFLKRNLELQLQTARLALLRGDAANYRESLRTARQWIQSHFLTDDAGVQSALTTLGRLETETIAPSLPDISGSLRQLRRAAPVGDAT